MLFSSSQKSLKRPGNAMLFPDLSKQQTYYIHISNIYIAYTNIINKKPSQKQFVPIPAAKQHTHRETASAQAKCTQHFACGFCELCVLSQTKKPLEQKKHGWCMLVCVFFGCFFGACGCQVIPHPKNSAK